MSRGEDLRRVLHDEFATDFGMTDEQLQEFGDRALEASLLMRRSWRAVAVEIVRAAMRPEVAGQRVVTNYGLTGGTVRYVTLREYIPEQQ